MLPGALSVLARNSTGALRGADLILVAMIRVAPWSDLKVLLRQKGPGAVPVTTPRSDFEPIRFLV